MLDLLNYQQGHLPVAGFQSKTELECKDFSERLSDAMRVVFTATCTKTSSPAVLHPSSKVDSRQPLKLDFVLLINELENRLKPQFSHLYILCFHVVLPPNHFLACFIVTLITFVQIRLSPRAVGKIQSLSCLFCL